MAAKRVTATAINWAEFATKIPAANKASFGALKNKQDGYVRAVNQLPEALPAIDFSSYKGKVAQGNFLSLVIGPLGGRIEKSH